MFLSTYISVFVEHLICSDLVLTRTPGHHHHVYDLRLIKPLALTERAHQNARPNKDLLKTQQNFSDSVSMVTLQRLRVYFTADTTMTPSRNHFLLHYLVIPLTAVLMAYASVSSAFRKDWAEWGCTLLPRSVT